MTEILELVHDTETPFFHYNHETELMAVVNLAYLSARDSYRIKRKIKREKDMLTLSFIRKQIGMLTVSFWN